LLFLEEPEGACFNGNDDCCEQLLEEGNRKCGLFEGDCDNDEECDEGQNCHNFNF